MTETYTFKGPPEYEGGAAPQPPAGPAALRPSGRADCAFASRRSRRGGAEKPPARLRGTV